MWRDKKKKCTALRCGKTRNASALGQMVVKELAWSWCPRTLSEVSEDALTLWVTHDIRKACFRQVRSVEGRREAGRARSKRAGIEERGQAGLGQRQKGWEGRDVVF